MNALEVLLRRYKNQIRFSLLTYSAVIGPIWVDQMYLLMALITNS